MDYFTRYLLWLPFVLVALTAWCLATYSGYRCWQTLPHPQRRYAVFTVPAFTRVSAHISPEGIMWRSRFYLWAGVFMGSVVFGMIAGAALGV